MSFTLTRASVADTANVPAVPWTNPNNSIDGNTGTSADALATTTATDFLDVTLSGQPTPAGLPVTNLSVVVRISATPQT